jgi:signal transduction histidine kinase
MEQLSVLKFFKHVLVAIVSALLGWALWRISGSWIYALLTALSCAGVFSWLFYYYESWALDLVHLQEKTEQLSNALHEANLKTSERNEMLASKINELTTLRRITLAMSSTIELDAVLEVILEAVTQQLKYDGAQFYLYDSESKELRLYKTMGNVEGAPDIKGFARCLKDKKPMILAGQNKHSAGLPVLAKDEVIGMLIVSHDPLKAPLTETDIRTLSTYTYQAGMAVENARLYQTEKHFHEELARQVEIAKGKLLEAQKKLIQNERMAAMGEAAAVVAHEIKNPLGSIRASAQLMIYGIEPGDKRHRYVQLLLQEINRLDGVANSLLDYAKPLRVRPEKFNVHDALREVLEMTRAQVEEKKIDVVTEFNAVKQEIEADVDQLKQVVINVVQNAFNFMGNRTEKRLKISTRNIENSLQIDIEDTGEGIPPDVLPHIFEPFYTTRARGTGLGLAICHRLMAAHHGSIEARTQPGAGATFVLTFPERYIPGSEAQPG